MWRSTIPPWPVSWDPDFGSPSLVRVANPRWPENPRHSRHVSNKSVQLSKHKGRIRFFLQDPVHLLSRKNHVFRLQDDLVKIRLLKTRLHRSARLNRVCWNEESHETPERSIRTRRGSLPADRRGNPVRRRNKPGFLHVSMVHRRNKHHFAFTESHLQNG